MDDLSTSDYDSGGGNSDRHPFSIQMDNSCNGKLRQQPEMATATEFQFVVAFADVHPLFSSCPRAILPSAGRNG